MLLRTTGTVIGRIGFRGAGGVAVFGILAVAVVVSRDAVQNDAHQLAVRALELFQRVGDEGARRKASADDEQGAVALGRDQIGVGDGRERRRIDEHVVERFGEPVEELFKARPLEEDRRVRDRVEDGDDVRVPDVRRIDDVLLRGLAGEVVREAGTSDVFSPPSSVII